MSQSRATMIEVGAEALRAEQIELVEVKAAGPSKMLAVRATRPLTPNPMAEFFGVRMPAAEAVKPPHPLNWRATKVEQLHPIEAHGLPGRRIVQVPVTSLEVTGLPDGGRIVTAHPSKAAARKHTDREINKAMKRPKPH